MVGICITKLIMGNRANPSPPLVNASELPVLFGICTYMFKSQYILPGIITPIKTKRRILAMISTVMIIILTFYLLISFTAAFWLSVNELQDLYTLNFFIPFVSSDPIGNKILSVCGYYIVLYPVISLSPTIPVESIVMRENLKALTRLLFKHCQHWTEKKKFLFTVDHILLPTIAIVLPLVISFTFINIDILLSFTGGVFGVWIQYVISTALLFAGKYLIIKKLKTKYENKYKSIFSHIFFLFFIIVWTILGAALVMVGDITKLLHTSHAYFK